MTFDFAKIVFPGHKTQSAQKRAQKRSHSFSQSAELLEFRELLAGVGGDPGLVDPHPAQLLKFYGDEPTDQHQPAVSTGDIGELVEFGYSVSIDGNWAVVGAFGENNERGAIYLYEKIAQAVPPDPSQPREGDPVAADNWVFRQKIVADDSLGQTGQPARDFDRYGYSVDIDVITDGLGNPIWGTMVVGAYQDENETIIGGPENAGSAYVYELNTATNNWEFLQKIEHLFPQENADFGKAVAIDQNYIVIGAPRDDWNGFDTGAAYVFWRDSFGDDTPLNGGDDFVYNFFELITSGNTQNFAYFGSAVDVMDGDGTYYGSTNGQIGTNFSINDEFRRLDSIVIGAPGRNSNGASSGSVYTFDWASNTDAVPAAFGRHEFRQTAELTGGSANSLFGTSVAIFEDNTGTGFGTFNNETIIRTIDEGHLAIGAPGANNDTGEVYTYRRRWNNNSAFNYIAHVNEFEYNLETILTANDGQAGDLFGTSVAISEAVTAGIEIQQRVVVGAPGVNADSVFGNPGALQDSGAAYIFDVIFFGNPVQVSKLLPTDRGPLERFGQSVALWGDDVLVGAPHDDDLGLEMGSAYLFDVLNREPRIDDEVVFVNEGTANGTTLVGGYSDLNEVPASIRDTYVIQPLNMDGEVNDLDQELTFQIVDGNTSGAFTIDPVSGDISIANSALLDYDTNPVFYLTIRATDSGFIPRSDNATVRINVVDVNLPPIIEDATFNIPETTPPGIAVGTVTASDPDPADTLAFSFNINSDLETGDDLQADYDRFVIDPVSGTISVAPGAVFDPLLKPQYTLVVRATDSSQSGNFSEALITINIDAVPLILVDDNFVFNQDPGVVELDVFNNDTINPATLADLVDPTNFVTENGGTLIFLDDQPGLYPNGYYTYQPAAGFAGTDTFVYSINGTTTEQETHPGAALNTKYGEAVAISGDVMIVGAPSDAGEGKVHVYRFNGGTNEWDFQATIDAPTDPLQNPTGEAQDFGAAVAIVGDLIAIGAPRYDAGIASNLNDTGAVYLFDYNAGAPVLLETLESGDPNTLDLFGGSLALDSHMGVETLIIGARLDDEAGVNAGAAYIFDNSNAGVWEQQSKLLGSSLAGNERFGEAVDINGDTVIVGSWNDDDNGTSAGAAYIFQDTGSGFTETAKLLPSDGRTNEWFGFAVSIFGDTVAVGARHDNDHGTDSGSVYIFNRGGSGWQETTKLIADNVDAFDNFGHSVDLSADVLVVGSWNSSSQTSGAAYIFNRSGNDWSQGPELQPFDSNAVARFGVDVAVDQNRVVVGGVTDSNGSTVGAVNVFDNINLIDSATVTITINDTPDAPVLSIAGRDVAFDSPLGYIATRAIATDIDLNEQLTFVLDSASSNVFGFDALSGLIYLQAPLTAGNIGDMHTLTISVYDSTQPVPLSDTTTVTLTIAASGSNGQVLSYFPWNSFFGTSSTSDSLVAEQSQPEVVESPVAQSTSPSQAGFVNPFAEDEETDSSETYEETLFQIALGASKSIAASTSSSTTNKASGSNPASSSDDEESLEAFGNGDLLDLLYS